MKNSEGKYKVGTTVYAKAIPDEPLTIKRYVGETYYCLLADKSDPTDLLYFEKELMSIQEKRDSQ
jgi:hypothetical protein